MTTIKKLVKLDTTYLMASLATEIPVPIVIVNQELLFLACHIPTVILTAALRRGVSCRTT